LAVSAAVPPLLLLLLLPLPLPANCITGTQRWRRGALSMCRGRFDGATLSE